MWIVASHFEIGMSKVIPLEEDRFGDRLCQGIAEAVNEIKTGSVPRSFSKVSICFAG